MDQKSHLNTGLIVLVIGMVFASILFLPGPLHDVANEGYEKVSQTITTVTKTEKDGDKI